MSEERDWDLIRKVYASECNDNEFQIFKHLTESYDLDPISKEIWCIKSKNQQARIFVSRDGHLAIAHRSGHWGSIKTIFDWGDEKQYMDVKDKYGHTSRVLVPFSATCILYRNDNPNPTEHTVYWDEYGSNTSLWASKPKTMLQKVAECQGLRRAYNMHGFYSIEEINDDLPALDSVGKISEKKAVQYEDIPDDYVRSALKPTPTVWTEGRIKEANKTLTKDNGVTSVDADVKKVGQSKLEEEDEVVERDFTRTNKSEPTIYDYDRKGMQNSLDLYNTYKLDTSVFERAKIKEGFWDKDVILNDYKKQMKEKGLL